MKATKIKQVRYQIGVDILGFPVYIEHIIVEETKENLIKEKRTIRVF
jgi:hypothetical protein